MTLQIHKLTQYLRGWGHYYLIANAYQLTVELDHWIRRRIRMCYWRQWRKPRTKVRSLMKLGVSERLAIACGITSKGPCRSSKTKGINIALGNDYLVITRFSVIKRYLDQYTLREVNRPLRTRTMGGVGAGG